MGTFRKLAREAIIFMLLGPVVAALVAFGFLERRSIADIKVAAARGVYAIDEALDEPRPPVGFRPVYSVLVPLTNGVRLFVKDCHWVHPFDPDAPHTDTPLSEVILIQPGQTNGVDYVYFDYLIDKTGHINLRPSSVPLGDVNQIAIEKEYWQSYAKAKREHRIENVMAATVLSLWGFLGGLILWVFYRLVRFAVKG